jgi:hypothetical protein
MNIIKSIRKWWRDKYIGSSGVYPKYSCIDFLFVFIKNTKTDANRIQAILDFMTSSDPTTRIVIYDVVRDHYPQYKKVLENPDRYRILL